MKARSRGGGSSWGHGKKLGLPIVFLICSVFFLAGFFGSMLLSSSSWEINGVRPESRVLESSSSSSSVVVDEEEKKKFQQTIPIGENGDSFFTTIPFQVLSWNPRAVYFPGFANADQCQHIIKMAKENLKPSTLALRKGETAENTKGVRTSSGTFIGADEDKTGTLDLIEEKIARATLIPRNHGEAFNVLRYEIGQRYLSHYDAFSTAEYGPQKSNRMASFLLYLSDVEEGGETMFPYENGRNMDISYDYEKCIGLKVKPRQGDALLFYSFFPNHTIDPKSLHGSCSVVVGEKWVATKWIRDQEGGCILKSILIHVHWSIFHHLFCFFSSFCNFLEYFPSLLCLLNHVLHSIYRHIIK